MRNTDDILRFIGLLFISLIAVLWVMGTGALLMAVILTEWEEAGATLFLSSIFTIGITVTAACLAYELTD